ncbi:MAG: formimidoylglutamase [Bacteroidales bacterium]|jgi:arginase family enzyme|nr:formimidoylglutamase [Bacteroidales bacterium]
MKDISVYFEPIEIEDFGFFNSNIERLGHLIVSYNTNASFPTLNSDIDIAVLGVKEARGNKTNSDSENAPDAVRKYLYNLTLHDKPVKIADLGNLRTGNSLSDTYVAMGEVVSVLLQMKIIPIILGGSQDLTYGNYRGYEQLGQIINLFCVDSRVDLGLVNTTQDVNSETFLTNIMCCEPNYLFNYTQVAYQTYFVDKEALDMMNDLYFDCYRLGVVQADLERVEPLVRNADMVSIDISAVRQSDAPAVSFPSPHGLYGEELCRICRYAGMSDKLTSIGFYELNPMYDHRGQTAALVSHAVWYFIDGYLWRKRDFPYLDTGNYIKFFVSINEGNGELVFYKSKKSERWWMQVPCSKDLQNKYQRHYLVPCSYDDYRVLIEENKIPDRWFKAYNKIGL